MNDERALRGLTITHFSEDEKLNADNVTIYL
jgi:hypothetical protein